MTDQADFDAITDKVEALEAAHFEQPCHPTRCSHIAVSER